MYNQKGTWFVKIVISKHKDDRIMNIINSVFIWKKIFDKMLSPYLENVILRRETLCTQKICGDSFAKFYQRRL